MALTLDQARTKLFKYVSPTLDAALVTDRINSALERIYNSGKWKGLMIPISMPNSPDPAQWWTSESVPSITLPRQFQSALGVQFGMGDMPGIPRLIYPRWQEYIAGGGGQVSPGTGSQMLIDLGDGFVTYSDPTAGYYPRLEITDSGDVGAVVKIAALDANGDNIFDADGKAWISVTLTSNGVTLPTLVSKVVAVVKPVTQGPVNLFAVSPSNSSLKAQIANYEPTETVPSYKRYKVSGGEFATSFNLMCKRRFVSLVNGSDDQTVIVPGNEGALKMTLMALQYEDKNDLERAETYFQKAIQLLNAELKEDMGAPVITLQMNPTGAAMRIPARY
jgi:hypothetical protein